MAEDTTEIVRDGDVVLVVTDINTISKFKVHSSILRKSSRVFSVMLGPDFAEGKALQDSHHTCEIQLQGDSQQSLALALKVIHGEIDAVPDSLDGPTDIVKIAVITDKYLLHEAMHPAINQWLAQEDLHTNLHVAIILNDHRLFAETSKAMIRHEAVSYSRELYSTGNDMLTHCLVNIDKARDLIRSSLPAEIHAIAIDLDSNPDPCPRAYYHAGLILRQLYNLDNKKQQTLDTIFEEVLQALAQEIKSHNYLCFDRSTNCLTSSMQDRCKTYIEKTKELLTGLCLECEILKFEGETGACIEGHSL